MILVMQRPIAILMTATAPAITDVLMRLIAKIDTEVPDKGQQLCG
jgi:hypothetical protein